MADAWAFLFGLLVALSGALLLGILFERLRLSWVAGCLVAGVVAGPSALGLVKSDGAILAIAEIGVALLLFTIGLEFSARRLFKLGAAPLLAGVVSVVAITLVMATVALAFGRSFTEAVLIGMALSLGSTAVVLRILKDSNMLDSVAGRTALAILLVQDLAVVVMLLIAESFSVSQNGIWAKVGQTVIGGTALVVGLLVFVTFVLPKLVSDSLVARNRELPILLAITVALGSTWLAHEIGISPAIGAFIAGMLLSDTVHGDQMRSDVHPLKTLFITVFFVSVGLLVNLNWVSKNWAWVLAGTIGVLVVKTLVTLLSVRLFQRGIVDTVATGLILSQIGEFSFVLAEIGRRGGHLSEPVFQLIVSITFFTILVTPGIVRRSPELSRWLAKTLVPARLLAAVERSARESPDSQPRVVLIGYGDAGRTAANALVEQNVKLCVVDLSPTVVKLAHEHGHRTVRGDATSPEILKRAGLDLAPLAIVAVPDPHATRIIVRQIKLHRREVAVVARARYHTMAEELDIAGADLIIDEEVLVGESLGRCALQSLMEPVRST
ncbi:MAG: cation:proton antiporter [Fimbriimonadaceae bacterium]|nr:cation:proton antiporter [Fimbriimonadaceae bacterium]QYK59610.1 MAG: cation:proton antiporter [Fimbriimonadaceae bacterium]